MNSKELIERLEQLDPDGYAPIVINNSLTSITSLGFSPGDVLEYRFGKILVQNSPNRLVMYAPELNDLISLYDDMGEDYVTTELEGKYKPLIDETKRRCNLPESLIYWEDVKSNFTGFFWSLKWFFQETKREWINNLKSFYINQLLSIKNSLQKKSEK